MVATISVLGGGARGVAAYFTATSGYYDLERRGEWFGTATEKLGLSGEVDRHEFEMLLAGFTPGGDRLARKTSAPSARSSRQAESGDVPGNQGKRRADRVPGYDVCFSAPKSVSLLWAVGSKQVRTEIESCMTDAVSKTLKDMESLLPLARRGRNGTQQIQAELATAMFLHTTSRDLDPQLHVHSVIPNLCCGSDGRWGSVNSRMLHNWTPTLGRVFRCHLGKALIEKINVELERPIREDGKLESWFEVKGVSKQVIKEFSQRRVAIEEATPRGQLGDSRARSKANEETRRAKDPSVDLKSLGEQWRGRADSHGFNREKIDRICGQNNERTPFSTAKIDQVIEEAIQTVGREKAHFREWNVVSQVCESLQHYGVDATSLVPQVMEHLRQSPNVMPLDTNPRQQQYSTQKNWQLETGLLADINAMNESRGAVVSKKSIDNVCKQFQRNAAKPFSKEQEQAVQKLLSDESSIRILTGVAGSGKSITLDAVREGFERQGYQVLGGALAGTAAQGLGEKTNISSRTVASYLHHLDKSSAKRLAQRVSHDARMMTRALLGKRTFKYEPVKIPQKSVLIIDEAGMLDTKTLSRLVHHVKKAKATLILVGDTHQLPPIRAGGPLDRASEKLGRARLSKNHRQLDQEDRKAVSELRAGKVEESLENYRLRDRLTVTRSHGETIQKIVEAWNNQGGTKKPEEQIILTQTRADAHEVNARCQQERLANKSIGGMGIRHGQTTYYRGDRAMFHIPMRKYGIENGFTGTITGTDLIRRSMTVRLDQTTSKVRGRKQSSQPTQVTIPLSRLDHSAVSLGYAATTHKLQGATVDHALVLLGGTMLSRELAYTQLTRARKTTRLFASQDQAGKDLELLIKGMNRSVKKDLAHDVMERSGIPIPTSRQRQHPDQSLER